MLRIPLVDLEELRRDPVAYRNRHAVKTAPRKAGSRAMSGGKAAPARSKEKEEPVAPKVMASPTVEEEPLGPQAAIGSKIREAVSPVAGQAPAVEAAAPQKAESSAVKVRSIFRVLKGAIHEYHKASDAEAAQKSLVKGLRGIKNGAGRRRAAEDLEWYISAYEDLRWPSFMGTHRITIPLSTRYADSLRVTGEIQRADIHPDGAYAGWLFVKGRMGDRLEELRMPIIQDALGVELGVEPDLAYVGIYSFADHCMELRSFTAREIDRAYRELEKLFRKMGF